MTVLRINKFISAKGKSVELYEFLCSLKGYINASEGNLLYEVAKDTDDEERFLVVEKWDSIESHQKSVKNFPKEEMSGAMDLFGDSPEGKYYNL